MHKHLRHPCSREHVNPANPQKLCSACETRASRSVRIAWRQIPLVRCCAQKKNVIIIAIITTRSHANKNYSWLWNCTRTYTHKLAKCARTRTLREVQIIMFIRKLQKMWPMPRRSQRHLATARGRRDFTFCLEMVLQKHHRALAHSQKTSRTC